MGKTPTELQALYLDWVNNFISVLAFAAHHRMTEMQAAATIEHGRVVHEAYVAWRKDMGGE